MREIQKQHIVDIFVWVDDSLPKQVSNRVGGRPSALTDSELLTIVIWDGLCEPHKNLPAIYAWIEREYRDYFPKLPRYQNFVAHVHRLLPQMVWLLQSLLASGAPLRFAGSTMLPVCKPIRADRHNRLVALVFTPASEHDNQHMERLVNEQTKVLVGDSHYGGSVMRKRLWQKYRTIVVAPPHHTQKKKLAADWQMLLLHMRPKIEATFGTLKEQRYLVTSFPRSVQGYFTHYVRVLLGYQMSLVSGFGLSLLVSPTG